MLTLIVAAACLCRGLTPDETQQVSDLIEAALLVEGPTISASRAHELLTHTIASVVEATRGVDLLITADDDAVF